MRGQKVHHGLDLSPCSSWGKPYMFDLVDEKFLLQSSGIGYGEREDIMQRRILCTTLAETKHLCTEGDLSRPRVVKPPFFFLLCCIFRLVSGYAGFYCSETLVPRHIHTEGSSPNKATVIVSIKTAPGDSNLLVRILVDAGSGTVNRRVASGLVAGRLEDRRLVEDVFVFCRVHLYEESLPLLDELYIKQND